MVYRFIFCLAAVSGALQDTSTNLHSRIPSKIDTEMETETLPPEENVSKLSINFNQHSSRYKQLQQSTSLFLEVIRIRKKGNWGDLRTTLTKTSEKETVSDKFPDNRALEETLVGPETSEDLVKTAFEEFGKHMTMASSPEGLQTKKPAESRPGKLAKKMNSLDVSNAIANTNLKNISKNLTVAAPSEKIRTTETPKEISEELPKKFVSPEIINNPLNVPMQEFLKSAKETLVDSTTKKSHKIATNSEILSQPEESLENYTVSDGTLSAESTKTMFETPSTQIISSERNNLPVIDSSKNSAVSAGKKLTQALSSTLENMTKMNHTEVINNVSNTQGIPKINSMGMAFGDQTEDEHKDAPGKRTDKFKILSMSDNAPNEFPKTSAMTTEKLVKKITDPEVSDRFSNKSLENNSKNTTENWSSDQLFTSETHNPLKEQLTNLEVNSRTGTEKNPEMGKILSNFLDGNSENSSKEWLSATPGKIAGTGSRKLVNTEIGNILSNTSTRVDRNLINSTEVSHSKEPLFANSGKIAGTGSKKLVTPDMKKILTNRSTHLDRNSENSTEVFPLEESLTANTDKIAGTGSRKLVNPEMRIKILSNRSTHRNGSSENSNEVFPSEKSRTVNEGKIVEGGTKKMVNPELGNILSNTSTHVDRNSLNSTKGVLSNESFVAPQKIAQESIVKKVNKVSNTLVSFRMERVSSSTTEMSPGKRDSTIPPEKLKTELINPNMTLNISSSDEISQNSTNNSLFEEPLIPKKNFEKMGKQLVYPKKGGNLESSQEFPKRTQKNPPTNETLTSEIPKIGPENVTSALLVGEKLPIPLPVGHKPKLGGLEVPTGQGCPNFCQVGQHSIGSCSTPEDCYQRGGIATGTCCGSFLVCCKFTHLCGGTSGERLVNFQSPDYPLSSRGTLACDFELNIHEDVCAVRVDFVHVHLYGKLGGVCDVDQILILNSVDGPTSSQCGDITGYTTTVAVRPGQQSPLKIVVIAQNEGYYHWDIRLLQIRCNGLRHFRHPSVCGAKTPLDTAVSFYELLDLWNNAAWRTPDQFTDNVWWRDPGPTFNRFYYETTRKAMQKNNRQLHAEDRIIGGADAVLHEFPWQVAVILKRVFFCGGALINDEFVLTAAHCFLTQETPVADLVVFLGDHDLTSSNDTISEVRGVKRVHYHAHFHALLLSNDIALLQLDRPVSFSQRVRPACLPNPSSSVLGLSGMVAGWGITSYPEGKPNAILQKLEVQVMSNEFCEAALSEDLGPGNLCALPSAKQGTCFGDSGGPLTVIHQGKDTLIGIVSFGITGCAMGPEMPDLYTRVSEYLQWIEISALNFFE